MSTSVSSVRQWEKMVCIWIWKHNNTLHYASISSTGYTTQPVDNQIFITTHVNQAPTHSHNTISDYPASIDEPMRISVSLKNTHRFVTPVELIHTGVRCGFFYQGQSYFYPVTLQFGLHHKHASTRMTAEHMHITIKPNQVWGPLHRNQMKRSSQYCPADISIRC